MAMMGINQGMPPQYQTYNPNGNTDWSGLLSTIGTGAGLYAQGNAQNNSANLAQQYTRASGQLNPFTASAGPGGLGATMNNGNVNLNYGSFNPAYGNLAGASGGAAGTAAGIGAPAGLSSALNGAFGQAAGGLGGFNPYGAGFAANNAFLGAGNAASAAGAPQQSMMDNYMRQLQALQAPGIQHQTDQLQGTLFGNGQTGNNTTGGYIAQQFGQGLASQNTQNALAASQLGLQGQQVAANTAGTLGGLGNNLLSSAFSNFGGSAGLPAGLQGQYISNAGQGIGAAGQLTNQGLGLYNAGLQTSLGQNQASSRAGYLASNNANAPNQQSPFGQLTAGLFGSAGGSQALQSILGKIPGIGKYFGGNSGLDAYGQNAGNPNFLNVPGAGQGGNAGYINDPSTQVWNQGNGFQSDFSPYVTAPEAGGGNTAGYDPNNPFGYSFNGAGGQAANAGGSVDPAVSSGYASNSPFFGPGGGASNAFGGVGNAAGIANGIQQGGVSGYGSAALNANSLANRAGGYGTNNSAIGTAGSALGIYNGVRQGGVAGYGGAALNAGRLATQAGALGGAGGALGQTLGPLGEAMGIYNGIKQGGLAGYGSAALNAYGLYGAAQGAGLIGGTGAAAGAGAGAGLGAGLAAAAPFAAAALAIGGPIYGMTHPAVELGSKYWNGVKANIGGSMLEVLNMPSKDVPQDVKESVWKYAADHGISDIKQGTWGMPDYLKGKTVSGFKGTSKSVNMSNK